MNLMFSIIVPIYNVERFLSEALDSLVGQTYANWEAICVDDGSNDRSGAILDAYSANDNRFRVIHQSNAGVTVARQVGLDAAVGDIVTFVDADDRVTPSYLQDFQAVMRDGDVDFAWCDYSQNGVRQDQSLCGSDFLSYLSGVVSGRYFGSVWGKAFVREFLTRKKIAFPAENLVAWEDLVFVCTALISRPRIKYVPKCNYEYRVRCGSILRSLYTTEKFNSAVCVQQLLERLSLPEETHFAMQLRRKEIKFNAYRWSCVSASTFYGLYPEVRELSGLNVAVWHKVLFWLAVRGGYTLTVWLFRIRRLFRNVGM